MFLKSLTLRGFKSFADKTVLDFEPGITVIVGPNGSGKSNVVDALAWVLGTRSAKLLRGGELADVIFAGSPSRPALGSAAVEITIDNSRGQLGRGGLGTGGTAQEFSEVRVSREILASGESRYAINGVECRLLDIQELLSDAGMGRELHTIVGQGQLDEILHAKPEERRAFIEEAAGILKHRRRRERAQRKLEQVDVHLEKLRSVLRELRRQLKPLERQAEAANQHAAIQAQLRDVQLRLAAHDLAHLRARMTSAQEGDAETLERQRDLESRVASAQQSLDAIEEALARDIPAIDAAREASERLARLRERLKGTADLIEARRRHLLEAVEEPVVGRPPDELRAQADRLDRELQDRVSALGDAEDAFEVAAAASKDAQLARRDLDRRRTAAARERADARERLARWEGEVQARRTAIVDAQAEGEKLDERLGELDERQGELQAEVDRVQDEIRSLDAEEWHLTERLEQAERAVTDAEQALETTVARERELERERSSASARAEALRAAASSAEEGAAALMHADLDGILGLLADHVRIRSGAEAAVAVALGPVGEAVVARSSDDARRAVAHLRTTGSGRAIVLAPRDPHAGDEVDVPEGAEPVVSLIEARGEGSRGIVAALGRALRHTYLAEDWDTAVSLHERHTDLTFVTRDGDVAGPFGFAGGDAPERSAVLTAAAAEEAEQRVTELDREVRAAEQAVVDARAELDARRRELEGATDTINESDARITGSAEELAQLNQELAQVQRQLDLLTRQREELADTAARNRRVLTELESDRPEPVPAEPEDHDGPDGEAAALDEAVEHARQAELDARLQVERLDEQVRQLERNATELRQEADSVEEALAEAARRRELRRQHIRRCGELAGVCTDSLEALDRSMGEAQRERDRLESARSSREADHADVRSNLRELTAELEEVREHRHEADLRRAEVRHRLEQVEGKVRGEFGMTPEDVLADHPDADRYERDDLVSQEDTLVRKLGMLGRVNPLALEEFHALEERHKFLSRQMEDLRQSRRDLEDVIAAVDDKIRDVFAEAFEDVAREFQEVFASVFPGGEGRLVLTEPEDMLATGIEVEARPPGKRVRRLSLLSGGERSLTALAVLFAIFRARPSPFYVLDEVEAALDDVNLQRLLHVIEQFKEHSQLLVVTHQKRTMEVADVLYGVTMGSDAVSKVVAERIAEPVSV